MRIGCIYFILENPLIGTAQNIERDKLITILPTLGKEFNISFEFFATDHPGFGHVLQFMLGASTTFQYGDQIPDIFYRSSTSTLRIYMDVNNVFFTRRDITAAPNTWHHVQITQNILQTGTGYRYSIYLNGKLEHTLQNMGTGARVFNKVRVYASEYTISAGVWESPYEAQPGQIRNLYVHSNGKCASLLFG